MAEEDVLGRLGHALQTAAGSEELSSVLDELKYLTYGNKRRKRELLSRSAIASLLAVFENESTQDSHRESIFNILSSLLKLPELVVDETLAAHMFHLSYHYTSNELLSVSALRATSSLLRLPLPAFVVSELTSDNADIMIASLLSHTATAKLHFVLKILSYLVKDKQILEKLVNLGLSDVVCSRLFSDDIQELDWVLQCIYEILQEQSESLERYWKDGNVMARMRSLIGPFFPASIQIATAKCLLCGIQFGFKFKFTLDFQKLEHEKSAVTRQQEGLVQACLVTIIRCCRYGEAESNRAQAVGLLSSALMLRDSSTHDEDSRYLKEMFLCVLPTATSTTLQPAPVLSTSPIMDAEAELQSNALLVIAQLLLNNERSRMSVRSAQVSATAVRISRKHPPKLVKGLLRALHALSRSLEHLKTTFDNKRYVEFVVDCLLNESDAEFLEIATSLIGNLSLHYCTARPFLIDAVAPLAALAQRNKNPSITLNAVWALMPLGSPVSASKAGLCAETLCDVWANEVKSIFVVNKHSGSHLQKVFFEVHNPHQEVMNLACQSTAAVKLSIFGHFAAAEALTLLSDSNDEYLTAKVLALYRNLYCQHPTEQQSTPPDVLNALSEQSSKNAPSVIEVIRMAFESHVSPHTKEIALTLLANLCAVPSCQAMVANDEILIACIMNELRGMDSSAHMGAVLAICNLVSTGDERARRNIQPILSNSALPHLLSHIVRTSAPHNVHLIRRWYDYRNVE